MGKGTVDTGLVVAIVLLGLLVLGSLALLPRPWRSQADIQREEATKWWPFSEAFRAGFLRSVFVVMLLVDLSVTLFNRPKFIVPPETTKTREGLLVQRSEHDRQQD